MEATSTAPVLKNCDDSKPEAELTTSNIETNISSNDQSTRSSSSSKIVEDSLLQETSSTVQTKTQGTAEDCSLRERLKRHRSDVAGRVWVPEMWGQESFLQELIDCTAFDSCLASSSTVMNARASLIEQGTMTRRRLKIENPC